jgi:hypothetical protein
MVNLREIFRDEVIEEFMRQELDGVLEYCLDDKAPKDWQDDALIRSIHVVRAHYSVPGTYMEGAYDHE